MKKEKISVLVAVKNEEKNIRRCLESVKWADEIIIIDSKSADRTLEIAERYNPNVYQFKKEKYLLREKLNFGISKAKHDWVLMVDADEEVTPGLRDEIPGKIMNAKYDAFTVSFRSFAFGRAMKGELWVGSDIIRLFKRKKATYKDLQPHSLLSVEGGIGNLSNQINHYVYPDTKSFIKKTEKYTSLSAPLIAENMKGGILQKERYKINLYSRFIEPLLFVFWIFIMKKEYKDALTGLWLSMLMGYYLYLERMKVKEILDKKDRG